MNKKSMKALCAIALILCLIMSICTVAFAADVDPLKIDGKDSTISTSGLQTTGQKIIAVIRNVGIVLAVIVLMILGIKYMTGSVEEKAEYKKTMIPYVIGIVVLIGAIGIASAIVNLSAGVAGTTP